jgi:hypothetical protein
MFRFMAAFPLWVRSVGAMIDHDAEVRVLCTGCKVFVDVNLPGLAERVGRDYSLIDRRCRCRLTPGCRGWNRFYYRQAVFRPLWSDATGSRWLLER